MEDEIAEWLIDCYKEGSFTIDEANEVIREENVIFSDNRIAHDLWDAYLDYLGHHEKVILVKGAVELFLDRMKRNGQITG